MLTFQPVAAQLRPAYAVVVDDARERVMLVSARCMPVALVSPSTCCCAGWEMCVSVLVLCRVGDSGAILIGCRPCAGSG